jgi:hypothetical protein
MTRVFLAAGAAALAISAPASAERGGHGGKGGQAAASVERGGGDGQRAAKPQRAQRSERVAMPRAERSQRSVQRGERGMRMSAFERRPERANRVERSRAVERQQVRGNRTERLRAAERQQVRANRARVAERQQIRANRLERAENHGNRFERIQNREIRGERVARIDNRGDRLFRVQERNGRLAVNTLGCPPGLVSKGCMPPGQALQANRIVNADAFRASRLAAMTLGDRRILNPYQAVGFVGSPYSTVNGLFPLMALPSSVSYLYPDTPDYYYRYGNGYLYEVDRDTSLIAALLPLLGGGFMPGQYLPNSYMSSPYYGMNSYVPASYGFNSFYPDYGNDCYRYGNGVVYDVDCYTGLVENVIPMYAGGYGVGQLLPSSYGYYNVPSQYRSTYYNTPDYNYWYAPGAIYQYDPSSSLITSVAALLSPGFTIGQQLPLGYSAYNVPYAYRSSYFDTPNAYYRYNNGNIYQVDPTTMLVTAIVASILT